MNESHWERVERLETLFFEKLESEKDDGPGSALTKVKQGMDQWIAFEKGVERLRGYDEMARLPYSSPFF
jgi:hypothetical protein